MVYAKFVAVLVGMGVLWIKQQTSIDIGDDATQKITDLVVMVLTAIGVFSVPNTQK